MGPADLAQEIYVRRLAQGSRSSAPEKAIAYGLCGPNLRGSGHFLGHAPRNLPYGAIPISSSTCRLVREDGRRGGLLGSLRRARAWRWLESSKIVRQALGQNCPRARSGQGPRRKPKPEPGEAMARVDRPRRDVCY